MTDDSKRIFTSYPELASFIAELIGVDGWEGDTEYFPFSSDDASKGFLEIVYPVAAASGRLLRGAAGNGPIFIFLYCRGAWTYLGEMHGAKVEAVATSTITEFKTYAHISATTWIERLYRLSGGAYVCVMETDVSSE